MVIDAFLVYSFIKRLVTPFNKMPAYQLNLIDDKGNFLKARKDFNAQEKKALQLFDVMIINLKKLIAQVPFGKTRIATIAAAMLLLRSTPKKKMFEEATDDLFTLEEEFKLAMIEVEQVFEDMAVNNVSGISGLTPDTIGITPEASKRYKKKNERIMNTIVGIVRRK